MFNTVHTAIYDGQQLNTRDANFSFDITSPRLIKIGEEQIHMHPLSLAIILGQTESALEIIKQKPETISLDDNKGRNAAFYARQVGDQKVLENIRAVEEAKRERQSGGHDFLLAASWVERHLSKQNRNKVKTEVQDMPRNKKG